MYFTYDIAYSPSSFIQCPYIIPNHHCNVIGLIWPVCRPNFQTSINIHVIIIIHVYYHNLDLISFGISVDEFTTVNIYLQVLFNYFVLFNFYVI